MVQELVVTYGDTHQQRFQLTPSSKALKIVHGLGPLPPDHEVVLRVHSGDPLDGGVLMSDANSLWLMKRAMPDNDNIPGKFYYCT